MKIWEVSVQIILLFTSFKVVVPQIIKQFNNYQEQQINDYIPYNKDIVDEPIIDELQEITLKRSQRKKKVCYFKWLCGISTRIRI
jgi:predicted methyltransferase